MSKHAWRKVALLSDWVPFESYLSERAALLTDGSTYAAFEADGRAAETADAMDVSGWTDAFNHLFKNVVDNRLIFTVKLCRGVADATVLPTVDTGIPLMEDLAPAYNAALLANTLYFNKLYITVQYRPAKPAGEWLGDQVQDHMGKTAAAEDSAQDRLMHLERICAVIAEHLAGYSLRRLGLVTRGPAMFDEMAEAEVFACTGVWRPVPMTTGRVGNTMFSEDVTFHHEHIEIRG
ncbi:MAG: hypothetical protein EOP02_35385, partial [Proteobacteria bacterium]